MTKIHLFDGRETLCKLTLEQVTERKEEVANISYARDVPVDQLCDACHSAALK